MPVRPDHDERAEGYDEAIAWVKGHLQNLLSACDAMRLSDECNSRMNNIAYEVGYRRALIDLAKHAQIPGVK